MVYIIVHLIIKLNVTLINNRCPFSEIGYSERIDRNPFIPISASQVERFPYKFETPVNDRSRLKRMPRQVKLKKELTAFNDTSYTENVPMRQKSKVEKRKNRAFLLQKKKPHFQVTYWMFYPYNQVRSFYCHF